MLRAAVLDGDDGGGGNVGEADGGVGGVDVLAAGAAGAHDVCADVGGGDVVIAVGIVETEFFTALVGEAREDEDRSRGCVGPTLGLGRGHTLDAMYAGFALKDSVGAWSGDFKDGFLDVLEVGFRGFGRRGGVKFDEGGVERVALAEGLVHAQEVANEYAGFGATGAGADFEETWESGERVGRDEAGLDGAEEVGEAGGVLLDLFGGEGAKFGVG